MVLLVEELLVVAPLLVELLVVVLLVVEPLALFVAVLLVRLVVELLVLAVLVVRLLVEEKSWPVPWANGTAIGAETGGAGGLPASFVAPPPLAAVLDER